MNSQTMKFELLYPEVAYLYGDLANIDYLHRAVPEAEVIRTSLKTPPAFLNGDVQFVSLCAMTERAQELVIAALRPYRDKIVEQIDRGTIFLATGNALEIFIKYIENEDGSKVEALGLFDLVARRRMMNRYNALYLGQFEDIRIVGLKSQFTHAYSGTVGGDDTASAADGGAVYKDAAALFDTLRGAGRNPEDRKEGIRQNNFMATYVLGPLLIMNPLFTKHLLGLLGLNDRALPFEAAAMDSYNLRLEEYSDPKRGFIY
jgi:CobQ-like glutamine amidotransferase family enzyme